MVAGLACLIDVTGIALDPSGDLFVADGANNRVVEFPFNASTDSYPASGVTVAGTGGEGSGSSQLNGPTYLATDSAGDLFVADTGNNRVQEFTRNPATGSYPSSGVTVAGSGGKGSGPSQLSAPGAVALNSAGALFVADNGNNRVQEFSFNAATGSYTGTGVTVYKVSGVPITVGQLAVDSSGDVYLVLTYPPWPTYNPVVVDLVANPATGAYTAATATVPLDNGPAGIAVDGHGNLFIPEGAVPFLQGAPENLVQEVSPTSTPGTYSSAATLSQVHGTGVSPLSDPVGVTLDGQGNLYVADAAASTVLEFKLNAATGTYSSTGTTVAGAGGAGSGANQLSGPDALALDSHGNLFIADAGNNRVVEYTLNASTGTYSATGITVAGAGGAGSGANQLSGPDALALDSHGNLFIADAGNNRVVEYTLNASTGTYSATGTTLATSGRSLALDSHGNLFVGDPVNNRVVEYPLNTSTGAYSATATVVAQLGAPGGIAAGPGTILVDAQGDIFAGGGFYTDDVVEFPINTSTGKYPSAPTVLLNGPGAGPGQVTFVSGLALDAHGDLFIADAQNQRIQELVGIASSAPTPPAPVVSGISPATGPAAGGTMVTVSGSNLSGGSVSFGSGPATSSSCTASSCSATSPAGSGTVNVTVTTTGGTSTTSTADQFTYTAAPPTAPVVTGITPATGPVAGGTAVTVTGTSLSGGSVAFGTTPATGVSCTATSCTATSPAGSGTVNVTVTTSGGTSMTSTADQFSYQATPPPANLIPNPGFESAGVPADYWGSTLARSQAVVHSGAWALAQTTSSGSGGWDLDSNPSWYAPISSSTTYTASIWVRATATAKVDLNVDLLDSGGNYVDSANGPTVTLTAGSWTQLTIKGIKPAAGEVDAAMEPNFSSATKGTIIYWDDMSLTSP